MEVRGFGHGGVPVNNLEAAISFYTQTLGLRLERRIVSTIQGHTAEEHGATIAELSCGDGAPFFLWQRSMPRRKDALGEDGIAHSAFVVSQPDFEEAMGTLKQMGLFDRGPVVHPSGPSFYFFDPDGNYLQLEVHP